MYLYCTYVYSDIYLHVYICMCISIFFLCFSLSMYTENIRFVYFFCIRRDERPLAKTCREVEKVTSLRLSGLDVPSVSSDYCKVLQTTETRTCSLFAFTVYSRRLMRGKDACLFVSLAVIRCTALLQQQQQISAPRTCCSATVAAATKEGSAASRRTRRRASVCDPTAASAGDALLLLPERDLLLLRLLYACSRLCCDSCAVMYHCS